MKKMKEGFAVVAIEIRKLADHSKQAAGSIGRKLEEYALDTHILIGELNERYEELIKASFQSLQTF
ncbi:MAG: hypothetical protein ACRCTE_09545 [Cellulosilyticaceae bacterium]